MDLMTGCASLTKHFMFPDKGAALLGMAFETSFIDILIRGCCPRPYLRPMGLMAIRTAHLSFQNRMAIGKVEFCFLIGMAGQACFRVLLRIDDQFLPVFIKTAARINVGAPRPMTHLASLS